MIFFIFSCDKQEYLNSDENFSTQLSFDQKMQKDVLSVIPTLKQFSGIAKAIRNRSVLERDNFPNQTVDDARAILEATSNFDYFSDKSNLVANKIKDGTITVAKVGAFVDGADLAVKYNQLYNDILSQNSTINKFVGSNVEVLADESGSVTYQYNIFTDKSGSGPPNFQNCTPTTNPNCWPTNCDRWRFLADDENPGTCPENGIPELQGEYGLAKRLMDFTNGCFPPIEACPDGTGGVQIGGWLSFIQRHFIYDDDPQGYSLSYLDDICLSEQTVIDALNAMNRIIADKNPNPEWREFNGAIIHQVDPFISGGDIIFGGLWGQLAYSGMWVCIDDTY